MMAVMFRPTIRRLSQLSNAAFFLVKNMMIII